MKINNINFFVEDFGPKDGTPICFLNGVMASTTSWYELKDFFVSLGYRVILHDFKGQLKSDKPNGPYTFKDHANETISILDNLGIKKAHFIGTSYGGEVGLNIGFRHKDYVLSLSIINSVSETDKLVDSFINSWINLCKQYDGYKFFWGMAPSIYGPKYLSENHEFLEKRAFATSRTGKEYFDGQIILYETFRDDVYMTDKLNQIEAKTLIIATDSDLLKPLKFSKIMANNIKNSELIIFDNVGHVTIFEAPERLKTVLLGFIKKCEINN